MSCFAYLFEAHSIQRYVMDGGKLAEMVGASELLEALVNAPPDKKNGDFKSPLDQALNCLKLNEMQSGQVGDFQFSRRGGGAFYILFDSRQYAEDLMALWGLVVSGMAPGLPFCHAIGDGNTQAEAINAGQKILLIQRNQPQPIYPEIGPLIRRSSRTGMPVTTLDNDPDGATIYLDNAAAQKKKDRFSQGKALRFKFLPGKNDFVFPRNLDKGESLFPFLDQDQTVAVIHADGNGLGQILISLKEKLEQKATDNYAEIFYEFSKAIDSATQKAAQSALKPFVDDKFGHHVGEKYILPFRPLILGGDDLTIIVRADLALAYTEAFLKDFERETGDALKCLKQNYPLIEEQLPDKLTACAGLAYVKANQPFYLAYQLAESLCAFAKKSSKKIKAEDKLIPASLCFHRITTSIIDDYETVRVRELSSRRGDVEYCFSLGAYSVGDSTQDLPKLDELQEVVELFEKDEMASGMLRHYLTLLHNDFDEAKFHYKRWHEVMRDKFPEYHQTFMEKIEKLLGVQITPDDLPFIELEQGSVATFLQDVTTLMSVGDFEDEEKDNGNQDD